MEGLQVLAEEKCNVPNVYGTHTDAGYAILYMDFIPTGYIRDKSQGIVRNMKSLYSTKKEKWGWKRDNYIGSLSQKNKFYDDFDSFFWETRLAPMLESAVKKGHFKPNVVSDTEKALSTFSKKWKLNNFQPRLIHGDLWNGNIIVGEDEIFFIDPSVACAHPEQDMAMLNLFGSSVNSKDLEELTISLGMPPGLSARIPFWQLYPLLVHVNIFGSSYVDSYLRSLKLCL